VKTLYVKYSQTERGGEVRAGEETASYPSCEDRYLTTTLKHIARERPVAHYDYEEFEVPDEIATKPELFIAAVFYTDGGTFSCTHGYLHVVGAFATDAEAHAAIENAKADTIVSMPWVGYFSEFDDSRVELLRVVQS